MYIAFDGLREKFTLKNVVFLPPSLPPSQPSDVTDLDSIQPFSQNYLVELTAFASSSQDRAIDELRNFAEYLKPYPTLPDVLKMSNPPLWRESECVLVVAVTL